MTDAIIIGGGPAAAAAALTLLNAQISVTIVERELFPRYRPGETLHPGIEPLLNQLGVAEKLHFANYIRHRGIWSSWGNSPQFVAYGEDNQEIWHGFQAPRGHIDRWLIEAACDQGAELIEAVGISVQKNTRSEAVEVVTSAGRYQTKFVIDCSGSSQFLARQLHIGVGRYSPRLIARFGYVRGQYSGLSPSIRSDLTGWTWIAEIEPQRFQWTRVTEPHHRPSSKWVPEELRDLQVEHTYGADVTWRLANNVAGPGYFLCGDSAVQLDPSSSHGVLRAIMSGMMAAHQIVRHICFGADPLACASDYQDWLSSWFQHDIKEMKRAYGRVKLFGFGL